MEEEKFLTRQEAAVALGVHINTLDNIVKDGKLSKYERTGRKTTFFKESEIIELSKMKLAA